MSLVMDDIPKIGITGMPNVGKTETIVKIINSLEKHGYVVQGMITEPIIEKHKRVGFHVTNWKTKEREVFAHIDFETKEKVGKYGVDTNALEKVGVPAIENAILDENVNIIVIDEIGKMELFSNSFREAVWEAIRSGKPVLGTIMLSPNPWADELKRQPQVKLAEVTRNDFHRLLDDIKLWLPKE